MIIDILIMLPWIAFGVLGFRDASVRKLTAIVTCILGMFLGQWLMHDLGTLLREKLHVLPEDAPVRAFAIIFFSTGCRNTRMSFGELLPNRENLTWRHHHI